MKRDGEKQYREKQTEITRWKSFSSFLSFFSLCLIFDLFSSSVFLFPHSVSSSLVISLSLSQNRLHQSFLKAVPREIEKERLTPTELLVCFDDDWLLSFFPVRGEVKGSIQEENACHVFLFFSSCQCFPPLLFLPLTSFMWISVVWHPLLVILVCQRLSSQWKSESGPLDPSFLFLWHWLHFDPLTHSCCSTNLVISKSKMFRAFFFTGSDRRISSFVLCLQSLSASHVPFGYFTCFTLMWSVVTLKDSPLEMCIRYTAWSLNL